MFLVTDLWVPHEMVDVQFGDGVYCGICNNLGI
jgi:hypothetical protein